MRWTPVKSVVQLSGPYCRQSSPPAPYWCRDHQEVSPRGKTDGGVYGNRSGYRSKIGYTRPPATISASKARRMLSSMCHLIGTNQSLALAKSSSPSRSAWKRARSDKYQITRNRQVLRGLQDGLERSGARPARLRASTMRKRPSLSKPGRFYHLSQPFRLAPCHSRGVTVHAYRQRSRELRDCTYCMQSFRSLSACRCSGIVRIRRQERHGSQSSGSVHPSYRAALPSWVRIQSQSRGRDRLRWFLCP